MIPTNPLDSIYYISLPENFQISNYAMHIDPSIPLPVQKKVADAPGTFKADELTQEQILAGILTIMAYDKQNDHIDYYRSILKEARPNIKTELAEAAIIKTKNEDFDLAEEIFSALRGFDPEDIAITLNSALFFDQRADSYRELKLFEDADAYDDSALSYYKTAMEAEPAVPDAFFNAGFFYLKKHDYKNAKDCFETYVALTCDIKDEDLGENGLYKKERAQELLNQIKNQNLDDDKFKTAYNQINSGEEEKGIQTIKVFLQHNPDVWKAWFMLGWGLRKMQRFSDAEQAFIKAISCGANKNADTFNELAICCIEQEEFEKAEDFLMQALNLDTENTKIISNLGYLALKLGKVGEAQKYFETVLELNPNDEIAKNELAKLEI